MIPYVYIVEHSYENDDCEEAKLIGVFSTKEKAEQIVKQYKKLPGFKDFPDNFYINKYELDVSEWKEGFTTKSAI